MGYAISWCKVREDQAGAFVAELGLTSSGKREATRVGFFGRLFGA